MEIIVKSADFSALGLGNSRWIETYIKAANITNSAQKTALRSLYNTIRTAGIDKKLEVFRLFFTGVPANDSMNVLNPTIYSVSFTSDDPAAHTTSGYQFSAAQPGGTSTYPITDLSNFHMHCWNNTSETFDGGFLMGLFTSVSPDIFNLNLKRGAGTVQTGVQIGGAGSLNAPAGYDKTKTGLLSGSRVGNTLSLYDGGSRISQSTVAASATISGNALFREGNVFPTMAGTSATRCKVLSFAYGKGAWTDADELALFTALNNFKTALGI